MADDGELNALLAAWVRANQEGARLTPAELCADRPDLLAEVERRIAGMKATAPPDRPFPTPHDLPVRAERSLATPERVGNFKVVKLLGRGGMGAVYLCEDLRLGRRAAVKVMLPDVADAADCRARFLREARAAARVEHDYIVPIWEVGEDVCGPFIAMPYLQGEMLDARMSRGAALPIALILKVARETSEALAAAHRAGLIHRDVKPANIWLEGDPAAETLDAQVRRCKILDFGLAMVADGTEVRLTATGAVMGTPAYMSPEQAQGQPADHRSDLFSLGAVLYEMAVGALPFAGQNLMSILYALATVTPPLIHSKNPQAPTSLSDLVERMLAKDPARRPQSALEVAAAAARIEREMQLDPSGSGVEIHPPGSSSIAAASGSQQPPGSRVPDFAAWRNASPTVAEKVPPPAPAPLPPPPSPPTAAAPAAKGPPPGPPSLPPPSLEPRGRSPVRTFLLLTAVAAGVAYLVYQDPTRLPWNIASRPETTDAVSTAVGGAPVVETASIDEIGAARSGEGGTFFNGVDLAGWSGALSDFEVAGGVLTGAPKQLSRHDVFLYSDKTYADFELAFTAQTGGGSGDCGLLFRGRALQVRAGAARIVDGPSVELGGADWGALTERRPHVKRLLHASSETVASLVAADPDAPQRVVVRCVGRRVKITVAGAVAVDSDFNLPPEGSIGWRLGADSMGLKVSEVKFADLGSSHSYAWRAPPPGGSPLDRLDPASIPASERFAEQPVELAAVVGSRERRTWGEVLCVAAGPKSGGGLGAFGMRSGKIEIWNGTSPAPLWIVPNPTPEAAPVTALRFDASGKKLYVARGDVPRRVECLELGGGEPKVVGLTASDKQIAGIEHPIRRIELCDQERTLFLSDGRIFSIYDLSGAKHRRWQPPIATEGVVFAAPAGLVFYAAPDRRLLRSVVRGGKLEELVPIALELTGEDAGPRAVSAGGVRLAVWRGGALEMWEMGEDAPRYLGGIASSRAMGISSDVECALAPDGQSLVVWQDALGWFMATKDAFKGSAFSPGNPDAPVDAAFSPDGQRAVFVSSGGAVRFVDVAGTVLDEPVPRKASSSFSSLVGPFGRFGPLDEGSLMLRAVNFLDDTPRFQLWDLGGAKPQSSPALVFPLTMRGRELPMPTRLDLDGWVPRPDGKDLTQLLTLYDGKWGVALPEAPIASASPDGRLVVVYEKTDGRWTHLRGLDCPGGEALPRWTVKLPPDAGPTDRIYPLRWFSADGRWFATFTAPPGAEDDKRAQLVVWKNDAARPTPALSMPIRLDGAADGRTACFADGLLFRVAADGETIVEQATGPAPLVVGGSRDQAGVRGLGLHPGGRYLARALDDGADVLDAATLDRVWSWKAPGPVEAVAFAPDGRHLVLHNGDRTVYVLRLALPEPPPPGRWQLIGDDRVDLIPLLGPEAAAKKKEGILLSSRGRSNQLVLPLACNGGYDLQLEVSYVEGTDGLWCFLPVGGRNVAFVLNVHPEHGGYAGLEKIDGIRLLDNGLRKNMAPLAPGKRVGVKISVRVHGSRAEVVAVVDKVKPVRWEGALSELSLPTDVWDRPRWFGLGAWRSNYRLHAATFKRVDGVAKQLLQPATSDR